MTPHVALLIPAAGERQLANLARDAIAKYTTDVSHEVWLLDHPKGNPWPASGSEANAQALCSMIQGLSVNVTHVFAMHDDSLPIRERWLSYLLSKPGPVVGVKASQRNGYAHPSGVLWDRGFAASHAIQMAPELPKRDAGEFPASWLATAVCWRPLANPLANWVMGQTSRGRVGGFGWPWTFDCDVSFNDDGAAFFAHAGGGTIGAGRENDAARSKRVTAWVRAAREALAL